ncbi:MAG: hypothetical protein KBD55_02580 [Candidatus Pacebacteria bacterium]|nr:hypothetical protein [Candidatus Paceibacterota bacterium]
MTSPIQNNINKKSFVSILLVGGVLLVAFSSFLAWSSREDQVQNSVWETYTDPEYGYELMYPSNWTPDPGYLEGFNVTSPNNIILLSVNRGPWFEDLELNRNTAVFKSSVGVMLNSPYEKLIKLEDLMIKGYPAVHYTDEYFKGGVASGVESVWAIRVGNSVYTLDFFTNSSKEEFVKENETISKIISSFKFTEKENVYADSKTYTSTQYGFEFKYPDQGIEIIPFSREDKTEGMYVNIGESQFKYEEGLQELASGEKTQVVMIDGKNYPMWSGPAGVEGTSYRVILGINKEIDFYCDYTCDSDKKIFDKILSTFKFTNTKIDTSNWKKYTDTKYGFEFEYPSIYSIDASRSDNASKWTPSIVMTTKKTLSVEEGSMGVSNDALNILPRASVEFIKNNFQLPEPFIFSEEYFSLRQRGYNKYFGKVFIDESIGFQLDYNSGESITFYSIFDNKDGTYFIVSMNEGYSYYYDQILSTFKFTK